MYIHIFSVPDRFIVTREFTFDLPFDNNGLLYYLGIYIRMYNILTYLSLSMHVPMSSHYTLILCYI